MSQKTEKKIRKAVRQKLGYDFSLLREIVKPRPRWLPMWAWKWGLMVYFKEEVDYDPKFWKKHEAMELE